MNMKKDKNSLTSYLWVFPVLLLLALSAYLYISGNAGFFKITDTQKPVLHIAIPYSDNIQDVDSNYYVNWLEQKTGLDLEFTLIRQVQSGEYMNDLFSSDTDVDIVMFGDGFVIDEPTLEKYVASGDIYCDDAGTSYYVNTGSNLRDTAGQILWLNYDWLEELGLPAPTDTAELENVLRAFRDDDPNKNGVNDEIPLAGACGDYAFSPAEFILNAYVYNDPYHSRYGAGDDVNTLYAASDAFREGLIYCSKLYEECLLDRDSFTRTSAELSELVNSPGSLVGAFTTASLSDVIYPGNPEIMARYIHVAPLAGPGKEQHAFCHPDTSSIGAIITERSTRKAEATLLLQTMCEEEASLIARYGEKGVDWDFSNGADVSIYGGPSTIVTRNYIWNTSQNKHLNGIGPMDVPTKYLRGVTWNGINSDAEYIDARAQSAYHEYLPRSDVFHEPDTALSERMDAAVRDFVTGERDIRSDEEWEKYIEELF